MVTIIAIDKNGNTVGKEKTVSKSNWEALQKFGKTLRWKEVIKKEEKNGKERRRDSGNSVKKAK